MSVVQRFLTILLLHSLVFVSTSTVAGTVGVYTDEAVFNAAWPGLEVETFEEAMVANGQVLECSSPLSSSTNDACFQPGDIIDGVSIGDIPGPTNEEMVVGGQGWQGLPSKMVAPNLGADRLNVVFNLPVRAVGFRLHTWGANAPDTPTVKVYGAADALIDTLVAQSSVAGNFLGIDNVTPITRIEVQSTVFAPEIIDDIRFQPFGLIFRHGFESP